MTTSAAALLVVHLVATAGMMGLIWFVQLVQYPGFADVGDGQFVSFEAAHMRRTSWVVGPLMGVEGVSALVVAVTLRAEVGIVLVALSLLLLAVIHASTVFLQVPAHSRLATGYDADVQRRLVQTNWVRTFGWSARTVVAGAMIMTASS
ncbi:MAG: hypothetical protein ACJAR2_001014 [Ilumatobacter sp.]|jgi:hypothetical protein